MIYKTGFQQLCFSCATNAKGTKFSFRKKQNKTLKFFLFNDCQPKTIGFRVSTSNLGHHHG